ncbi:hypothetical protein ACI2JA_19740 [Alkalihalobacillus sp. NPDC078783]
MKRRFVDITQTDKRVKEHIENIEDFTSYILKLIEADLNSESSNDVITIKNPNYRPLKVRIEPVNQPPILFTKD